MGADCGHVFCRACVTDYTASCAERALCPACRKPLSVNFEEAAPVRTRAHARGSPQRGVAHVHPPAPTRTPGACTT